MVAAVGEVVAVCEVRVLSPGSEVCEVLLDSSSCGSSCGLLEACEASVLPLSLNSPASCGFSLLPLKGA